MEEILKRLDTILERKEQVNGFQPFGYTDEQKEREIYFAGFEDGRAMLKIDLMSLKKQLINLAR